MELRNEVLKYALQIEDFLQDILTLYLNIFTPHRRALSNRSGSFSARNKIDLLYDLEVLNKEEHRTFVLFTEFRNQFVHNAHCNSFSDAVRHLDNDKGKQLLRFATQDLQNLENKYRHAFGCLYAKCLRIGAAKLEEKRLAFQTVTDFVGQLIFQYLEMIDLVHDTHVNLSEFVEGRITPNPKDLEWTDALMKFSRSEMARATGIMEDLNAKSSERFTKSNLLRLFYGRDATPPDHFDELLREYAKNTLA